MNSYFGDEDMDGIIIKEASMRGADVLGELKYGSSRLSVVIVKSPSDFEKEIIVISKAKSNSFDDLDLVIDAF
jgi:hypothetical protein